MESEDKKEKWEMKIGCGKRRTIMEKGVMHRLDHTQHNFLLGMMCSLSYKRVVWGSVRILSATNGFSWVAKYRMQGKETWQYCLTADIHLVVHEVAVLQLKRKLKPLISFSPRHSTYVKLIQAGFCIHKVICVKSTATQNIGVSEAYLGEICPNIFFTAKYLRNVSENNLGKPMRTDPPPSSREAGRREGSEGEKGRGRLKRKAAVNKRGGERSKGWWGTGRGRGLFLHCQKCWPIPTLASLHYFPSYWRPWRGPKNHSVPGLPPLPQLQEHITVKSPCSAFNIWFWPQSNPKIQLNAFPSWRYKSTSS